MRLGSQARGELCIVVILFSTEERIPMLGMSYWAGSSNGMVKGKPLRNDDNMEIKPRDEVVINALMISFQTSLLITSNLSPIFCPPPPSH
jgi:hypothetical protein